VVSLRPLDRKLVRDLWRMRGQAVAIALVAMCGIATFVTMRGSYEALLSAQTNYYAQYRFADVFSNLRRAPITLLERIRDIPGINAVEGRVVFDATLDVRGLDEPASARLVSLSTTPHSQLNRVNIRSGRMIEAGNASEILASESFATANALRPGDTLVAIINGRKERLRIVGIAISPEYVAEAANLQDAFNDVAITLAPHASASQVIEHLDKLLAPYGSLGAYAREEQVSHHFLENELAQDRVTGTVLPAIFLGVAAFLIHSILLRLTTLQRTQIALLKSFGYSNTAIGLHYLKFALLTVMAGGIAGIVLGAWLGRGLAEIYTRFFHFPTLVFSLSTFSVTVALLISVLAALLGTILAVLRVLALSPAQAMHPESPALFKPGPLERLGLQRTIPLSVRMVLRNLERSPLRALSSVIGLSLALALLITGQFSYDALEEIIRIQFRTAQRDDATVVFNEARNTGVIHNLAALPGVLRVEPFRSMAVKLRFRHREKKAAITGLYPERQLRLILDERERPVALPQNGIVLTTKLAQTLGVTFGDMLTVTFIEGKRKTVMVRVANIVDEMIGLAAYMDARALGRLAAEQETVSGAFLAIDPLHQRALFRSMKSIPGIAGINLREATLQSFLATVAENLTTSTTVLIAFACIIAIGVVYNAARIALSEHAIELASLRILGFTQLEVGAMLLGEQAILTLASLPLGCALGYGLSVLLSVLLSEEVFRIPAVVSSKTFLISIGVVLASAAASGLLVWGKVQRLDLIAVLKSRE
jgi:putative ABC transport system permease protein